jgi:hypothetical protein
MRPPAAAIEMRRAPPISGKWGDAVAQPPPQDLLILCLMVLAPSRPPLMRSERQGRAKSGRQGRTRHHHGGRGRCCQELYLKLGDRTP